MSLDDLLSLVTVGTGARATCNDLVVLVVAGHTTADFDFWFEAHRFGMALHTGHIRVGSMFEPDQTSSWLMIRNRNLYRHLLGPDELTRIVAGAALSTSRALMVAYLTSPRRLKGQVAAPRHGGVAGDAGEFVMALM